MLDLEDGRSSITNGGCGLGRCCGLLAGMARNVPDDGDSWWHRPDCNGV
jgi:hypothetical protein